jgi:hypothetical protein
MEESDERYQYSVAWIEGLARGKSLGRSVLMRGNHAAAADLPKRVRNPLAARVGFQWNLWFDFPSGTLNRFTVKGFNTAYYALHRNLMRELVSFECTAGAASFSTRSRSRRRVGAKVSTPS